MIAINRAAIERAREKLDPDFWAERHFYIPENKQLIRLAPHQRAILRYIFRRPDLDSPFQYSTVIYSTVKKSGKTAIAGLVARWAGETWGDKPEIYCLANDYEQAEGRIHSAAKLSIEFAPAYNKKRRELPGSWRVREQILTNLSTGATIKALAGDYKGEAGSNPSLSLWSELWGYELERALRLWDELTPPPTRRLAMRWVETYAGFEGESVLLYDLYTLSVKKGIQLQVQDLDRAGVPEADRAFEESKRPTDKVPIYVNDAAGVCAYWDEGIQARRMPWQQGEAGLKYYTEQRRTLRTVAFERFHLNLWANAVGAFIAREKWDACEKPMPVFDPRAKVVIGVDASVSRDCTALVMVGRHPEYNQEIVVRRVYIWTPTPDDKMDYDATLTVALNAVRAQYRVALVAYDPHQLHHWATQQRKDTKLRFLDFPQGDRRLIADKQLADMIEAGSIHHDGNPGLTAHVMAAAAKEDPDGRKLRIIKKNQLIPIDACVALSMAAYECLRLNLK